MCVCVCVCVFSSFFSSGATKKCNIFMYHEQLTLFVDDHDGDKINK